MSALHRDALDGVGHVGHGYPNEAFGHLLRRLLFAGRGLYLGGQLSEFLANYLGVERLISIRSEYLGEISGLDLSQHDIAVSGRAVTGGDPRRPRR